jgi:two-component system sensor histidine kinase/response regulator
VGDARPRVLVAEDNPEMALFIGRVLAPFCRVRSVADGEEALRAARLWKPDLVLSDVMMPKLDGISLTRQLKAAPETVAIPVVLLTAMTNRDSLMHGWEAGADDYLFKPFHPRELEARLKGLLGMVRWRERSEALRREREALEQFTHIASHDLREPLRKIGIFADRVASRRPGDAEDQRSLASIRDSAGRMTRQLEQLVEYVRLGQAAGALPPCDLGGVLAEVVQELGAELEELGGRVEASELPRLPAVHAHMASLFRNLLGNALKYRHPGRPLLVKVRSERAGAEWTVHVEDNGIGFDPALAERIFVLFERLHDRRSYPGEGMGLAICRRIVENHGGRIWADSEPGRGSAFHFTLFAEAQP